MGVVSDYILGKLRSDQGSGGGGGITGGVNVGSGIGEIFRDVIGTNMNFKTLIAGSGISITNNTNDITISSTGGGTMTFPPRNVLLVDPTLTPDGVKIFSDITSATAYALTLSPSLSNPVKIELAAGTFSGAANNVVCHPYVIYEGQNNTRITSQVTGGVGFADIRYFGLSGLKNCYITNLVGTNGSFIHLRDCQIASSTPYTSGAYCIAIGCRFLECNFPIGCLVSGIYNHFVSGTVGESFSTFCYFDNNLFIPSPLNVYTGQYDQCYFGNCTIADSVGSITLRKCFFANATSFTTLNMKASISLASCTAANLKIIILVSTTANLFVDNTNIRVSETALPFTNAYEATKKLIYYYYDFDYSNIGDPSTTLTVTLNTILTRWKVNSVFVKTTNQFTGLASLTMDVGYTGNPNAFWTGYPLHNAPSPTNHVIASPNDIPNSDANVDFTVTFNGSAALSGLTDGNAIMVVVLENLSG